MPHTQKWLFVTTKLLIFVTEGDTGIKGIKLGKHKVQEQGHSFVQMMGKQTESQLWLEQSKNS